MLYNIRLYTRVQGKLAKFILESAASAEEAIKAVREEIKQHRVFAVLDGGK